MRCDGGSKAGRVRGGTREEADPFQKTPARGADVFHVSLRASTVAWGSVSAPRPPPSLPSLHLVTSPLFRLRMRCSGRLRDFVLPLLSFLLLPHFLLLLLLVSPPLVFPQSLSRSGQTAVQLQEPVRPSFPIPRSSCCTKPLSLLPLIRKQSPLKLPSTPSEYAQVERNELPLPSATSSSSPNLLHPSVRPPLFLLIQRRSRPRPPPTRLRAARRFAYRSRRSVRSDQDGREWVSGRCARWRVGRRERTRTRACSAGEQRLVRLSYPSATTEPARVVAVWSRKRKRERVRKRVRSRKNASSRG